MARSAIEWTESTWNPVTGCTKLGSSRKGVTSDDLAERGDCPLGRCAGGGRRGCHGVPPTAAEESVAVAGSNKRRSVDFPIFGQAHRPRTRGLIEEPPRAGGGTYPSRPGGGLLRGFLSALGPIGCHPLGHRLLLFGRHRTALPRRRGVGRGLRDRGGRSRRQPRGGAPSRGLRLQALELNTAPTGPATATPTASPGTSACPLGANGFANLSLEYGNADAHEPQRAAGRRGRPHRRRQHRRGRPRADLGQPHHRGRAEALRQLRPPLRQRRAALRPHQLRQQDG